MFLKKISITRTYLCIAKYIRIRITKSNVIMYISTLEMYTEKKQ